MPVTKTAKRALRSSAKKKSINALIISKLEIAVRVASKSKSREKVLAAISLADRAAKKNVIHKNKADRIKSRLGKFLAKKTSKPVKSSTKKSSK